MPSPPFLLRWSSALLFTAALLAAGMRIPATSAPALAEPPRVAAPREEAFLLARLLPGAGSSAGAPTLATLPDREVVIAWQGRAGGAHAQDVIWFSRLEAGAWSTPLPASTLADAAGATFAHLGSIGSPILLAREQQLHLWFTADAPGGSGALLLHAVSTDHGDTWGRPERLSVTPLVLSRPALRNPPLALADGGFGLALDQTRPGRHGEWLRLAADGRPLDKRRLPLEGQSANPAPVRLENGHLLAFVPTDNGTIATLESRDSGNTWHSQPATALSGAGTPLAVLRLPSGRLLLAANPAQGSLALWLGDPAGRHWRLARNVETAVDGHAHFRDPALLLAGNGHIHLAYAWREQAIRHLEFNEAWLTGSTE